MTTDLLDKIAETLARLDQRGVDPQRPTDTAAQAARKRMQDARRGYPASSMGGGGRSGTSSPVEALVGVPDDGGDALRELKALQVRLLADAGRLASLVEAWLPKQPNSQAIRDTALSNVHLCEHCGDGVLRADAPTDVQGNLTHPKRLCRWCYDYAVKVGRLPDDGTLDRRRKGQRIRVEA